MKLYSLLLLSILFCSNAIAQYKFTFDDQNSGPIITAPSNHEYGYSWANIIYNEDILNNIKGTITKIEFRPGVGGYGPGSQFFAQDQEIRMRATGGDQFSNANYPGYGFYTLVYSGEVEWLNYQWSEIELDVPFEYNSGSLYILWESRKGTEEMLMPFAGLSNYSYNAIRQNHSNTEFPATTGTMHSSLPNIRLTFVSETDIGMVEFADPVETVEPETDHEVKVVFGNFKPDSIYTAEIHWELNGIPQDVYHWEGLLLFNEKSDTITLGSINLSELGEHNIKVWTNAPNGKEDENHDNDTITGTFLCHYETLTAEYTGTVFNIPMRSNNYSWSSVIYTNEEIGASGNISHIAYYKEGSEGTATNQRIYITTTHRNDFTDNSYLNPDEMTLVYEGTVTFQNDQWTYIELDEPFEYSGSDNLIIHYEKRSKDVLFGHSFRSINTYPYYMAKRTFHPDYFPTGSGSLWYDKPVMRFRFEPARSSDAAVQALILPDEDDPEGTYDVTVRLVNYGSEQLTSANIGWRINEEIQESVDWIGALDFFKSTGVVLGNHAFSSGKHIIEAWTEAESLNTGHDENTSNDTLYSEIILCNGSLSGTYNIPTNFISLSDAMDVLSKCGINDPVTLEIEPGTYVEQAYLFQLSGQSDENTLTITSVTGDSTDVVLASNSTEYTLRFEDVSHVTISGITIRNDSTGNALQLNNCSNITITNNRFVSDSTLQDLISLTGLCDSVTINQNFFEKGTRGLNSKADGEEIVVSGNTFNGHLYYGIDIDASNIHDGVTIEQNIIEAGRGIRMSKCKNLTISRNRVSSTDYPLIIGSSQNTAPEMNLVANNFITANGNNGYVYITDNQHTHLYHNTIKNDSWVGLRFNGANDYLYISNNIIENYGGPIYTSSIKDIDNTEIDHNSYYYNGGEFITGTSFEQWQDGYASDLHTDTLQTWFFDDGLQTQHYLVNNKGTPIEFVTDDIFGNLRDTIHPDIGAVEFDGCTAPMSGDYTIDISGDGDFSSFNGALQAMKWCTIDSSVTIHVKPGTYHEQFVLTNDSIHETSEDIWINFMSYDSDSTSVILTWDADSSENNYIIKFNNASNFSVNGLTLQSSNPEYSRIIFFGENVDKIHIANNRIEGAIATNSNVETTLVYCPYSWPHVKTGLKFTQNAFINGGCGVDLQGSKGSQFEKNIFTGQHVYAAFISNADSVRFINNIMLTNENHSYWYRHFNVMNSHNFLIDGNYLSANDFEGSGTLTSDGSTGHFTNNLMDIKYNGHMSGRFFFQLTRSNMAIVHNTLNLDFVSSARPSQLIRSWEMDSLVILNNIFRNNTGGLIYELDYHGSGDIDVVYADNNSYYYTGQFASYEGGEYDDLNAWTDETGNDSNSLFMDPRFITGTELYTALPQFKGAGKPVEYVTSDYLGNSRDPENPDIGAYEIETVAYWLGDVFVVCTYDTAMIDAGHHFDAYEWQPGNKSGQIAEYTMEELGSDSVWITAIVTLNEIDYTDSLLLIFTRPVASMEGEKLHACKGDEITLQIVDYDSLNTYSWDYYGSGFYSHPRETDEDIIIVTYTFSDTITVRLTVTDELGCITQDSIEVYAYEKPDRPYINREYGTLYCSETGTDYEWFINGITSGVTLQHIQPEQAGDYQVIVFNHGCPSDTSDVYSFLTYATREIHNVVRLYPNPVDDILTIEFSNADAFDGRRVILLNQVGKVIMDKKVYSNMMQIPTEQYEPGFYVLKIEQEGKTDYFKLIFK